MKRLTRLTIIMFLAVVFCSATSVRSYDLSKDRVQYVVTTAHLDTQWLWTIWLTRAYYLPLTTQGNFYLFEKYPDYLFNFESVYHYMLIKEYYPKDYEMIKQYVDKGNWHLSGGMIVACDVNVPHPESLIRQILYGNGFFQEVVRQEGARCFSAGLFRLRLRSSHRGGPLRYDRFFHAEGILPLASAALGRR